jgi:hypothetical protein
MPEVNILAELRKVRDEIAKRHGGDPHSLVRELAERSRAAGRVPIRLPKREPQVPRARDPQPAA